MVDNVVSIVNKPRVSKMIAGMYWGLAAFIGCIGLIFLALGILTCHLESDFLEPVFMVATTRFQC
jgi:hypothetical protein